MSNVVAATHVDEQCGCSPHSLFLGRVGTSKIMHCITSFAFAFAILIYLSFFEVIDVSTFMLIKFVF